MSEQRITVGSELRTYRQAVPVAARARRLPVLVVLHGGGRRESGARFADATGFDAVAARRGWIVLYPEARGGTFHAGQCCGPRAERRDDVRLVRALVARVGRRHRIDRRRVFATGFSNGGFLAYRLACEASRMFAAVAVVAAKVVTRRCRPRAPVSVLHVHGRADDRLPFGRGGYAFDRDSVPRTIARWRRRNRCLGAPRRLERPGVLVSRSTGCEQGTQVVMAALAGGHEWPGAAPPYGAEPETYDATGEIERFLAGLRPRH